jgi:glycine oxidase
VRDIVDVVVIGGGVIGCAVAYALTREGCTVSVLERDQVAAHASGGAAGILSTRDDAPGSPMDVLNRASLNLHPTYADVLREETRIDVEYQQAGSLALLREEDIDTPVAPDGRLLDREEMLDLEPSIGPGWPAAVFYPGDGQVNAARLTHALAEAATRRGAQLREGVVVTGLLEEAGQVRGVRTSGDDIHSEFVVLAAGPWSGLLATRWGTHLPVFPVKGEIFWARSHPHVLNRPVFAGCYLVPKPEIGLAIGATYVRAGFDERPTIGGALELLPRAADAVPALKRVPFDRAWSSLRPGTHDGAPILGPAGDRGGLIIATGHSAYGIALSLITGELVANWVLGRPQPLPTEAFSPHRFG